MEMHPFWLIIENLPRFSELGLGVGITAYSEDDAKSIFALAFGTEFQVAGVRRILAAEELEQVHVRPNMGNLLIRGIWYPRGYEAFL